MMGRVLIVLPVFKPNLEFLKDQLNSIADQSFTDYLCVVSFDGPENQLEFEKIREVSLDSRFVLVIQKRRHGTYGHIEILLSEYATSFEFVALCDQDDIWLVNKIQDQFVQLTSSKHSMITSNGLLMVNNSVSKKTLFSYLNVRIDAIRFAFFTNIATGAGSMYSREVILRSLPFPLEDENMVHDHWLYLVSLCLNGCILDPKSRWIYRIHSSNQIGLNGADKTFGKAVAGIKKIYRFIQSDYQGTFNVGEIFEAQLVQRKLVIPHSLIRPSGTTVIRKLLSPKNILASRADSIMIYKRFRSVDRNVDIGLLDKNR